MRKPQPCTRCGKPTVHTCFSCGNALCSKCSEIDLLCKTCRDKMPPKRNESHVRALLTQIDTEYASAQLGLSGLSQGAAQHQFITAKYKRIGELQEQLDELIGHDQAMNLVINQLNKSGE